MGEICFHILFFISRPPVPNPRGSWASLENTEDPERSPLFFIESGRTDSMKSLSAVSASRLQILYFAEDMRLMKNRYLPLRAIGSLSRWPILHKHISSSITSVSLRTLRETSFYLVAPTPGCVLGGSAMKILFWTSRRFKKLRTKDKEMLRLIEESPVFKMGCG